MCGIAGALGYPSGVEARLALVRRMGQAIHHRGPDDEGAFADADVVLGSQRLKVIDLAGGHQPMSTENGLHIVFNGEIFNYATLREQLRRDGESFATASDTEVVLRLYRRRGLAAFHEMNGMFGVAIWDARERRLHLVRDRMGVKPLYYYWDGRVFAFASEIKALFELPELALELEPRAIWDYLTFRYVPGPATIWKNVMKLPAGHRLTISAGGAPEVTRWWDIPAPPATDARSIEQLTDEFGGLFTDAVNARMVADVPVGIMLSGGIDSSAVAAVAAQRFGEHLKTFSVSFRDSPGTDERTYARLVAGHIGSDHSEIEIGERDFLDFLPSFVRLMDEPTADLASVPLYYVSKLARETVTVALSGEGADEILAGYDFDRWWRQRATGGGDLRAEAVPPHMTNYMDSAAKRELFLKSVDYRDSVEVLRGHLQRAGDRHQLDQMLFLYCQDWLVEDLLMKADKMSMANSLELRTPFLDYRLVEWAARAPLQAKIGPDAAGFTTKHVLRRFAGRLLPAAIIERPKRGFPVPVYDWLSSSLRELAGDLLLGPNARVRTWFAAEGLRQLFERGSADTAPAHDRHRLWNVMILEYWLRAWTLA
jgi:asparagine synthase (glutamine-hydrolysing)